MVAWRLGRDRGSLALAQRALNRQIIWIASNPAIQSWPEFSGRNIWPQYLAAIPGRNTWPALRDFLITSNLPKFCGRRCHS